MVKKGGDICGDIVKKTEVYIEGQGNIINFIVI